MGQYAALLFQIVEQQLSVAAARNIWRRAASWSPWVRRPLRRRTVDSRHLPRAAADRFRHFRADRSEGRRTVRRLLVPARREDREVRLLHHVRHCARPNGPELTPAAEHVITPKQPRPSCGNSAYRETTAASAAGAGACRIRNGRSISRSSDRANHLNPVMPLHLSGGNPESVARLG